MFSSASARVQFDVPASMRDGVVLRANVYRPEGDGPWPVLLVRTPYGKDDQVEVNIWLNPVQAARKGFIVVIQDTRGRFTSDGEWVPFRHEREDGYDSVEWAARLPGSNGRVGMYCASYLGNTQWMAAIEQPPSLGAIAPAETWCDPLDGLFARGGALELGLVLAWDMATGADHLAKLPLSDAERAQRVTALIDDYDRLATDGYRELPASDPPVLRRHGFPDLGTIAMQTDPAVADWCRVRGRHERVTVPSLHLGGWYDIFLQGTLDNYVAMAALGRPARLLIGPWSHDVPLTDPIGERCFGLRSAGSAAVHPEGNVDDVQLTWLRRQLTSDATESAADGAAPVRIFVMGRDEWRDEQEWPPARAREQRWLLGTGGTLSPQAPAAEAAPSSFDYDPADPVPTRGGLTVMAQEFPNGSFDQAPIEARPDVLVFTSEPLTDELEVTGRVRVVLHAQSSAPATDWVARLCDVHPDGRSFNLCDGILRVVESADAVQRVEIDLWSTANAFLPGHRLRVHVTSSSFPRWDRNLNTGDQRSTHFEVARQTVFHDADRPSWIELPVVDG